MKKTRRTKNLGLLLLLLLFLLSACTPHKPEPIPPEKEITSNTPNIDSGSSGEATDPILSLSEVPAYSGEPYIVINNNFPYFEDSDSSTEPFEHYNELDELGRCGTAFANICTDIMPTEERGAIGHIKPSGWHTIKYDFVDGKYLYNRCHLIGFQLAGENANEQNLITGTRYFNTEGMLPFEDQVADYVKETENHVLYRVTPVYQEENLLADGVLMEAWSVEDYGNGVCFCVFVYNVQPGVAIDYATGGSSIAEIPSDTPSDTLPETQRYVLNTNTGKFHLPDCSSVSDIKEEHRSSITGTRDEILEYGYSPCGRCKP